MLILCVFILFTCTIVNAQPTEQGMGSAPQNQGNALTDTNNIVSHWQQHGLTAAGLTTSSATKAAVLNYWQNDGYLSYYNNIGHADTSSTSGTPAYGLVFYDAEATSSDISSLSPDEGIAFSRVFINSCNSFENPLHDAFIGKAVEMYIGGIVELPMYYSEDTASDFWYYYSDEGQTASTALANAESNHGTQGMYGLYGN